MKRVECVFIREVHVGFSDDEDQEVILEVWRDPSSGAFFAVEASYLDQRFDSALGGFSDEIPSPYNRDVMLVLPESGVDDGI